jgi:serine/threonine-protein kinase
MSTSKSQRWRLLVGEGIAPGHVIADKYRLDRIIGTGGMAVVIEAWHRDLQERVAIKLLHRELAADREALARFEREGRAVFPMTSRHVARVLDVGKLPHGVPYIVMELLEGRDLARLVAEGPCAVDTAVDVALEACDALHAAHALGIVHRDLKPENIFLARCPNGVESVKVLDFGVSKIPTRFSRRKRKLTGAATAMGTPRYMAPELWVSARDATPAADVWALGVVLYELLAGRAPFDEADVGKLCTMILRGDPPALRGVRPEVPVALEAVIARALAKEPADRHASVADLAAALVTFASPRGRGAAASIAGAVLRRASDPGPNDHSTDGWQSGKREGVRGSRLAVGVAAAVLGVVAIALAVPWRGTAPAPVAGAPAEEPKTAPVEAAPTAVPVATASATPSPSATVSSRPSAAPRRSRRPATTRPTAEPAPPEPPVGERIFGKM